MRSLALSPAEPAVWADVADDVLALVRERLEPAIEVAANKLYEHVLSDVQEYLLDNAKFNISQTLASAETQAFNDRKENIRLKASLDDALAVLRVVAATLPHLGGAEMGTDTLCKRVDAVLTKAAGQ